MSQKDNEEISSTQKEVNTVINKTENIIDDTLKNTNANIKKAALGVENAVDSAMEETVRLSDEVENMLSNNPYIKKQYLYINQCSKKLSEKVLNFLDNYRINPSMEKFYFFLIIGIIFASLSILGMPFGFFPSALNFIFCSGGFFSIIGSFVYIYGNKEYFKMILNEKTIFLLLFFILTGIFGELSAMLEAKLLFFILCSTHIFFGVFISLFLISGGKGIAKLCKIFY